MKSLTLFVTILLINVYLFARLLTSAAAKQEDKVYWCHTEPNGNYQTLHLPLEALENAGHVDAQGNALHAGDYAGECLEPSVSPSPSSEPSISPSPVLSPSVTPEPSVEVTPTPSVSPVPTPSPTPSSTPIVSPSIFPTHFPDVSPTPTTEPKTEEKKSESVEVQQQRVIEEIRRENGGVVPQIGFK